jgi:ribosomal protein S12 methylthiotransferase
MPTGPQRFHVETLGCPKNAVDSDKVVATLLADGLQPADDAESADLIVVNTCAFIEAARQESIDTVLGLAAARRPGAKLVVTGCLAERAGDELAAALPEVDAVVGFSGEGSLAARVGMAAPVTLKRKPTGVRDLLELPRPAPSAPWAYVKVAEGCDRKCAFCAIPSFRGTQRSRSLESVEREVRELVDGGVVEVVLVAQDLAWFGRDIDESDALSKLLRRLDGLRGDGLARIRLLYLYPSEVRDPLLATMFELESVVPYFDLSLQHAAPDLLRRMKRWGSGERFLDLISDIRAASPDAVFRSSFISGFPGESEDHHEQLLEFLDAAQLDWAGFFAYSREPGTAAAELDGGLSDELVRERLRELAEVQEPITAAARLSLLGRSIEVLVDAVDDESVIGRTHREAPEIDGVVRLRGVEFARPGSMVAATVIDVEGPDLDAEPLAPSRAPRSKSGAEAVW